MFDSMCGWYAVCAQSKGTSDEIVYITPVYSRMKNPDFNALERIGVCFIYVVIFCRRSYVLGIGVYHADVTASLMVVLVMLRSIRQRVVTADIYVLYDLANKAKLLTQSTATLAGWYHGNRRNAFSRERC